MLMAGAHRPPAACVTRRHCDGKSGQSTCMQTHNHMSLCCPSVCVRVCCRCDSSTCNQQALPHKGPPRCVSRASPHDNTPAPVSINMRIMYKRYVGTRGMGGKRREICTCLLEFTVSSIVTWHLRACEIITSTITYVTTEIY